MSVTALFRQSTLAASVEQRVATSSIRTVALTRTVEPSGKMKVCNQCGNEFTYIGQHWRQSSDCHYPKLNERQIGLIEGCLLGDACINRYKSGKKPMKIEVITEEYLQYINKILGNISNGVKVCRTAEENSKRSEYSDTVKTSENYKKTYVLTTVGHPEISKYSNWYNSGDKRPPESLSLTPESLKNWYVCDGSFNTPNSNYGNKKRVTISAPKMISLGEGDVLLKSVEQATGANCSIDTSGRIVVSMKDNDRFFDFIGEPIDGFKYKWP